jgi:RimJ/RimL family protein N-acetyltransferase
MNNNIFQIEYANVVLRDPVEEDAERYVRWHLLETEWQNWDAPWEEVEKDEKLLRDKILRIVRRDKPKVRTRLQLCLKDGAHIGVVSWYNKDNEEGKAAVGIDIPEKSFWGRGLGMQALELWIAYLFSVMQIDCVYTETWSGNTRMTRLAEKLGF